MPREWVITDYSGFEGLRLQSCAAEEPGPTDVRLQIEAFALNWGDMDLMRDQYSFSYSAFPARIGMEAAGIVEAVGKNVHDIRIGDRYCTLPYFYDRRGASADTVLIDQAYITKAPEGLSAVESASIWMQFLTAYFPIVELAKAAPGHNIFVPAGTSTAGNAALQIGRMSGATMITTTRYAQNRAYLEASGADHVYVDDGLADMAKFLLDVTGGEGIHAAFDPMGGEFMQRYGRALATDAKLMMYGTLTGALPELPFVSMWQSNAWLHTYSLFNYVQNADACARGKAFVYEALAEKNLAPRVDRTFPMEGYVEAWEYLRQDRTSFGKVVIETGI
ncbi:MAG: zinc-binding dehydrogenase [Stappiaceae bacterium]